MPSLTTAPRVSLRFILSILLITLFVFSTAFSEAQVGQTSKVDKPKSTSEKKSFSDKNKQPATYTNNSKTVNGKKVSPKTPDKFKEEVRDAKTDLDAIKAQIQAALKSGKITEAQAKEKYESLYGKDSKPSIKSKPITAKANSEFVEKLAALVENGKLTKEEATDLYNSVVKRRTDTPKKGVNGTDYKINSLDEQKRLQEILPLTSTGDDKEGPVACGFFGWAADAKHRFMDNSHKGEARAINGLSFRLDYRDHDTIGRTWDNITVRIAHGNWSSIKYNASRDFELLDDQATVFNKQWSFPTLKGFPALKPAEWGGPQNCLNFQFDKPFMYNGKDAIYVEFTFSGGTTEDGRKWEGDLPYGFEYFLDSMQQIGGWRMAESPKGLYLPPRVEAVVSYTAGGQSVWTSSAKGMPYLNWDFSSSK